MKIYDNSLKYSGGKDSLELCLTIFKDLCPKDELSEQNWPQAFSTMLTGDARQFYYQRLAGRGIQFNQLVMRTSAEFETPERRRQITNRWDTISLASVRKEHPEKTLLECFEIMRQDMIKMQTALLSEMKTEDVIRDRIYRACRGLRETELAIFSQAPTFQGACDSLRTAISVRQEVGAVNQVFITNSDDGDDALNDRGAVFYTDRKFHGGTTRYGDRSTRSPGQRAPHSRTRSASSARKKVVGAPDIPIRSANEHTETSRELDKQTMDSFDST